MEILLKIMLIYFILSKERMGFLCLFRRISYEEYFKHEINVIKKAEKKILSNNKLADTAFALNLLYWI